MNDFSAKKSDASEPGFDQSTRIIADTAADAIITIDEESTIRFVNRGAEQTFGYTRAELIGQSLTMLMPDYLRHVHRAGIRRYLSTGERHISWEAIELPGLHKNGREIPLELSFGEFSENGKRFFTGIARDVSDRKEAEKTLQRREEYFRSLIENSADLITVLNHDGTRRYISPSVERSLGYTPEELIGKSPFDLLHPDDAPELKKLFAEGIANPGVIISTEYRIRHKNGSWRIHEASGRNLLDEPTVAGIVINSRDITDRKRLEQRLTAQYQAARIMAEANSLREAAPMLLRALCESLGWELGQLWTVDRKADVLRWLATWQAPSLGATEFEAASRTRTFVPGEGLPGRIWSSRDSIWIRDLATDTNFPRAPFAAASGLQSAFGFPVILGDEVFGVMEFFSRESHALDQSLLDAMTGIGNQISQFIERARAASERSQILRREQHARREAEAAIDRGRRVQTVTEVALANLSMDELLAELLDRVRDAMKVDTVAILLLEPKGDELVAWAAKGLEEEVELGVHIPLGKGFAGRIAADKGPVQIDDLDQVEVLNPLLREKGLHSLLGVPLLVEGRVIGVIHVGTVTPHKFGDDDVRLLQLVADRVALAIDHARLFEEERAARREAEAASRAKDEFLTTLSHELRTPLTPVIGWIHMIRSGILPVSEAEHGLSVIEKNSQALKHLINDLLDMSAILSGKLPIEALPVHLEEVVREAVESVRPQAAARDIELGVAFHNWRDEIVSGDRVRLGQVFGNLLNNAIKFSPPRGRVRVDCEVDGDELIVHVLDTGEGITPDFLPHVFERFRQADGSKTRVHGGLGLGLALVKSFVEAHHGVVEAKSQGQGQGSRLTVRLPRQESRLAAAAPDVREIAPKTEPRGAHILMVEDDLDTLEMLRTTFEAQGFRITTCESAAEALRLAAGDSVDLIVSDIGMPEMDGFEMMKQLRKLPNLETIPAIALTGYASQEDADNAIAAGFNAHVPKPIDPAELVALINQLLEQASGAQS